MSNVTHPREHAARRTWLAPSDALSRFDAPATTNRANLAGRAVQVRFGFKAGGIGLLVEARAGSEVLKFVKPAPIPNTGRQLLGVINLRGGLVPVFDLARICGIASAIESTQQMILVFGKGDHAFGFSIDGSPQPLTDLTALKQMPSLNTELDRFVVGGYAQGDQIWFELDFQRLLATLSNSSD